MHKSTEYARVWFPTTVVQQMIDGWKEVSAWESTPHPMNTYDLSVTTDQSTWSFDTFEEFYAAHRLPHSSSQAFVHAYPNDRHYSLGISEYDAGGTSAIITAPTRAEIERISAAFDARVDEFRRPPEPEPEPEPVRIFVGHGRSQQWRDLKDHLHEVHGYDVSAYEVGARAGHTIRDILEDMLDQSSFAVLVMTGEDETAEGGFRARQNVVHETGLFQGRLGFSRTVVLLEEGTEDYSNLHGIHEIRYSHERIKETYGEILGTIRREFTR